MLARFERIMERAFEGGFRRAFSAQLQPVQLAKAAARSMEDAQVVGLRGPEVPNQYDVQLAADDFQRFGEYRGSLERELASYLAAYARDRGLLPVGPPRATVLENQRLRRGEARVVARFVDMAPERQHALEEALSNTRALQLGNATEQAKASSGALVAPDGTPYGLDPGDPVLRIGRAVDNDVVLASPRVSRYHAQVRREGRRWLLYDLKSTNGTWVNGEWVGETPVPLTAGIELRFGDERLRYVEDG